MTEVLDFCKENIVAIINLFLIIFIIGSYLKSHNSKIAELYLKCVGWILSLGGILTYIVGIIGFFLAGIGFLVIGFHPFPIPEFTLVYMLVWGILILCSLSFFKTNPRHTISILRVLSIVGICIILSNIFLKTSCPDLWNNDAAECPNVTSVITAQVSFIITVMTATYILYKQSLTRNYTNW